MDVKELGIKHPLHRKKLQLALQALGSEEEDNKGKLDYNWVTSEYKLPVKHFFLPVSFPFFFFSATICIFLLLLSGWLDDIGLPQYKTQFDEGRVDGRMLHYMTVVSVGKRHALLPQFLRISRSDKSSAISH